MSGFPACYVLVDETVMYPLKGSAEACGQPNVATRSRSTGEECNAGVKSRSRYPRS